MQKNGTKGKTPGRWEELTISNDFMFCRVMSDADVCGEFIERLLGIKVARIEYVQPQKDVRITPDARGVRFDVTCMCRTAAGFSTSRCRLLTGDTFRCARGTIRRRLTLTRLRRGRPSRR